MTRATAVLVAAVLTSCATAPPAPDPGIDPRGEWAVVAVNGRPTGGWAGYRFAITPPSGSAQFGCNSGSGSLSIDNGWIVAGDWIITAAGCRSEETARLERLGFAITARPMAVEGRAGGIRLRNERGTIDLGPKITPSLDGRWRVIMVNGRMVTGSAEFSPPRFRISFGCNDGRGQYQQSGDRLVVSALGTTERGCMTQTGEPTDAMRHEDEGFRIVARPMRVDWFDADRVRLSNEAGTIDLRR